MSLGVFMDIVNCCNLQCPACPNSHSNQFKSTRTGDRMSLDTFRELVANLHDVYAVTEINLFNWAESFLHPDLPEFIAAARILGVSCNLSTNLKDISCLYSVMAAQPANICVSVSGWSEKTYNRYHRGSDFKTLQANLMQLVALNCDMGNKVKLSMIFHRYMDNAGEEKQARAYAERNGMEFSPVYAVHMPVETSHIPLPIHDKLCFPIKYLWLWSIFKWAPCGLAKHNLALNWEGRFSTCCATAYLPHGYFLKARPDEKGAVSADHCMACVKRVQHLYACHMLPFENLVCAWRSGRSLLEALRDDFRMLGRVLRFARGRL